jgi:hypothetical protein
MRILRIHSLIKHGAFLVTGSASIAGVASGAATHVQGTKENCGLHEHVAA